MKHPFFTTAILVALFLAAQVIGLALVYENIKDVRVVDGQQVVEHETTAIGDRPDLHGQQTFWFIAIGVGVGTALVLLLIKFKAFNLWRAWFFAAVLLALFVAFGVILPRAAAFALAFALAAWKVLRPGPAIHNLTELFVYAGIAVLIAPLFDLAWIALALVVISVYDMYAVWKSKHMVAMAQAQTEANVFAGFSIPKRSAQRHALQAPRAPGRKKANLGDSVAILGGGDVAFPLLFSSVVLVWLIEGRGVAPLVALYETLIVSAACTVALAALFASSKEGRFYPAMPFLSLGCFAGLGIVALL